MVTMASRVASARIGVTTSFRDKTGMSQMATTGSITGGSDQLVVANVLDFRIGDWVIVETGGEAGAGARGTRGVGGNHPNLSYANLTAMNADTSQPTSKYAWLEDTGDCRYWTGSGWAEPSAFDGNDYYFDKTWPKCMWAEILDIDGNTFTLSKTASVTATNANVYFDNWGIVQNLGKNETVVNLPAGTYYMSDNLFFADRLGLTIRGAGKTTTILKTPNGGSHGGCFFDRCDGAVIEDLTFDCNFKNDKLGFKWDEGRAVDEGDIYRVEQNYRSTPWGFGQGVHFYISNSCEANRVKIINSSQQAFVVSAGLNCWARHCSVRIEDPIRTYIQWQFQWTDIYASNYGGGMEDCDIDSDWWTPGFEALKSRDVSFIRCTGRNAHFSGNSSDGMIIEDMNLVFDDDKAYDYWSAPTGRPLIDFPTNISGGNNTKEAVITNLTLTFGRRDVTEERPIGITVGPTACPVRFVGTYQIDNVAPKGLIKCTAPWDGSEAYGGLGGRISGDATFENMRFRGEAPQGWNGSAVVLRRMVFREGTAPDVTLTNCVIDAGDNGPTGTLTESGTLTNAAFDALHPGLP